MRTGITSRNGGRAGPRAWVKQVVTLVLIAIFSKFWATPVLSNSANTLSNRDARLCDLAARDAAAATGVPVDLLFAISRTETGRVKNGTTEPWPWTVNMEGRGLWFDTQAEAMSYVFDHFKTGARSFDIGCFQINYRWHGAMFSSIEEMFDPVANARYAATFLKKLFAESGDWRTAAGAFHSRTPELADRYLVRFAAVLNESNLSADNVTASVAGSQTQARPNGFPLLQSGNVTGLASLVPLPDVGLARPVIPSRSMPGS